LSNVAHRERSKIVDDVLQAVLDKYGSKIKSGKVFFAPNLPETKIKNAVGSYAGLAEDEKPLVLLDNTVFGSAKEGILLTDRRIYARNTMASPQCIELDSVRSVTLTEGLTPTLSVNDTEFLTLTIGEKETSRLFAEMLREISRAFASPASSQTLGIGEGEAREMAKPRDDEPPGTVLDDKDSSATQVVQVPLASQYAMPSMCCACESTSGMVARGLGVTAKSGKRTISLAFPLCSKCVQARRAVRIEGLFGLIAMLVLGALAFGIVYLLVATGVLKGRAVGWGVLLSALCGGPIVIFVAAAIAAKLTTKRVGPEIYQVGKRASGAVTIKKYKRGGLLSTGSVAFEFTSPKFARLFAQMNPKV
jgi:hypothetical protein